MLTSYGGKNTPYPKNADVIWWENFARWGGGHIYYHAISNIVK
jgi:hypothetical protein